MDNPVNAKPLEMPPLLAHVQAAVDKLVACETVKAAIEAVKRDDELTLADQIAITEVEAPPFNEQVRAEDFVRRLTELGLEARIDEEGNVYMQVINTGDRKNNKAETGENIYFRYSRIDLKEYETGADGTLSGNQNTPTTSSSFYFNDYTYSTSYNWGTGLQMPLYYLGVDCEVNLLIKSQYGVTDEISMVMPFVYHVKYYRSKI